jgi:chemotaxis protein CheD
MNKKNNVGMAELKICKCPDELTIIGLGSCVALALYHKKSKTGGLVHVMLPAGKAKNRVKPGKYANFAIKEIYEKMKKKVGEKNGIVAKIAGGSQMFKTTKTFGIGEENIAAVKKELKDLGIKIDGEDCGKNYGRNITFSTQDGEMKIKCVYGESAI